jgi:hypothetical protein
LTTPERAASRPARAAPGGPRPYAPGDEPGAIAVLKRAFGGWPKVNVPVADIDHLLWKIDNNPQARALSLVTEAGGRIVAWQGYWMQPVLVDGRTLLAKQGVDFCVDPDYQGLGIRATMSKFAETHSRRNFQMHFGPEPGHPAMKRVVDGLAVGARRLLANEVEALVLKGARGAAERARDYAVRDVLRFDDRIDLFWERASQPFLFAVERRSEYLNWRYADERAGEFGVTLAEDNADVLGYLVRRVTGGRGYIADLLALPGRTDVAEDLLRHAAARLAASGVTELECWLPRVHPYQDVVRSCGFTHRRRSIAFVGRPSREGGKDFAFGADPNAPVHITIGDTDLI